MLLNIAVEFAKYDNSNLFLYEQKNANIVKIKTNG